MDSTRASNARVTRAFILVVFLGTVVVVLLISFIDRIRDSSFPVGLPGIVDDIVGAPFAALYVYLRDERPVMCLSSKVSAVLFPFVGPFAPVVVRCAPDLQIEGRHFGRHIQTKQDCWGRDIRFADGICFCLPLGFEV
ncbi:hypothetical protein FGB62_20g03 [Gracilaria domingensis]|nr:hypothetical protein FGB62_20g03 [Gracilaria domingensis]